MIINETKSHISINDRGLAYGDGLFETIAYVNGTLHNWDLHWQRLTSGCQRLCIESPDETFILNQIEKELHADNINKVDKVNSDHRVIKIIITRGIGGRGYLFPEEPDISVIISIHHWPVRDNEDYKLGIKVVVCNTELSPQPALAGIKHLNRLEQVLARNEFDSARYQDGLMLLYSNQQAKLEKTVIESTSSNLFFVMDNKLCTPEIDMSGIRGTIREVILNSCNDFDIEIEKGNYPLRYIQNASEVFFTNSIFGVVPVSSITIEQDVTWHFSQRVVTKRMAALINQSLCRPYKLG